MSYHGKEKSSNNINKGRNDVCNYQHGDGQGVVPGEQGGQTQAHEHQSDHVTGQPMILKTKIKQKLRPACGNMLRPGKFCQCLSC